MRNAATNPALARLTLPSVAQAMNRPGGCERGRCRGIRLFAGEDGFESGFEPAMRVLQSSDALGDDVVLLEHLLDGLRLLARELPIDIGDQQFVAEFGHEASSG